MVYVTPKIEDLGQISEHTFTTPGGRVKGCTEGCHKDSFNEESSGTA